MAVKIAKYVSIGTNNIERSRKFYDGLLGDSDQISSAPGDAYGAWIDGEETTFCVYVPFDGEKATVGNGSMTGFVMDTTDEVDAMYTKALALGASDEGAPGPRMPDFYGAYVRDPDGNKLVFCKMG